MASVVIETSKDWKTPLPKLVRFFHDSRGKWKRKHAEVAKRNKLLSNQVRAVEKSREQWRQVAEQSQQEVRRLQEELASHKKSSA